MDFAERLKENLRRSDALVPLMASSQGDYDAFLNHLIAYIKLRFVIDDTDFWTDDLHELCSFSMGHQKELAGDNGGVVSDTSLNCAGATSAETKQILLLMKLRKDLGVVLPPDYIGTASSVADVAKRIFSQL